MGFRPAPDVLAILRKLEAMHITKSRIINHSIRLQWKNALGKRITTMREAV